MLNRYLSFIRTVMGVPAFALPDTSGYICASLDYALEIVPSTLLQVSPKMYDLCVYNLAADNLLNIAQDVTGQTVFADARKSFNINNMTLGIIQSSSDEGTSESMMIPAGLQNLSLTSLQALKTPYGRQAMQIMQSLGSNWGIS